MKLYNKEELKHSRVFFDRNPPKFGVTFGVILFILLLLLLYIASIVVKPYIVRADGVVTSSDNQYIAPTVSGNVVEIVAKEGNEVKEGETLLIISNGQEKTHATAILSQLNTLNEKEEAIERYLKALETGKNILKNSGFEIEYYGKMEYYISQLQSENKQQKINDENIEKKKEKLSLVNSELSQLNEELKTLNEVIENSIEEEDKQERQTKQTNLENLIDGKESEKDAMVEEINKLTQQGGLSSQSESTKLQLLAEAGQAKATLMTQRTEFESQLSVYSSQDKLHEVKASNNGIVHYLTPMNIGIGLQQNQVFAEISTHTNEQKIVEAYLNAYERSKVEIGQSVIVRVLGVNSIQYGILKGNVFSIENGTITQETSTGNQTFYRIHISIEDFRLKGGDVNRDIEILKSMPVQAQIVYEEETYLMWLLEMLNLKKS